MATDGQMRELISWLNRPRHRVQKGFDAMSDKKQTLEIFIHNVTRAQSVAIEDMLATWQQLGSMGSSRWTAFFADGDGNFRPTCVVGGHVARHQQLVEGKDFWKGDEYRIDFDRIAWALREEDKRLKLALPGSAETPQFGPVEVRRLSNAEAGADGLPESVGAQNSSSSSDGREEP